jgi:hypothetical protein
MSRSVKAILGIVGAVAALGTWVTARRRRGRVPAPELLAELPPASLEPGMTANIEIDDDDAADIIRKAKPALERAALLK